MPILQHFIVEGKYLGTAERQMLFVHAQPQRPVSYAFFCPVCAEVWARCPVERADGTTENFMVWTQACRKHTFHRLAVPGSLTLSWEPDFTAAFPDELVRWEFDRHLDYAEKELEA